MSQTYCCPKLARTSLAHIQWENGCACFVPTPGQEFSFILYKYIQIFVLSKSIRMSHTLVCKFCLDPRAGGLAIAPPWLSWGCVINPYLSAFVTRSGQVLRFQILLCLAIVIVCSPDTYYGKQKVGLNWFAFWSLEAPRMQGGEGAGDLQHPNNN